TASWSTDPRLPFLRAFRPAAPPAPAPAPVAGGPATPGRRSGVRVAPPNPPGDADATGRGGNGDPAVTGRGRGAPGVMGRGGGRSPPAAAAGGPAGRGADGRGGSATADRV